MLNFLVFQVTVSVRNSRDSRLVQKGIKTVLLTADWHFDMPTEKGTYIYCCVAVLVLFLK